MTVKVSVVLHILLLLLSPTSPPFSPLGMKKALPWWEVVPGTCPSLTSSMDKPHQKGWTEDSAQLLLGARGLQASKVGCSWLS